MSNYEDNPAGLGVGQRYGPRFVGGVNGSFVQTDSQRQVVYDLRANEPLSGVPMTATLSGNYLVEEIYLVVDEAFVASSTADLSIDGGAGLTAPIVLSAVSPMVSIPITGLGNPSGTATVDIVLTGNANAVGSAVGRARVVVRYKLV